MRRALLIGAALACFSPSIAFAQSWVDTVLPERSFDFGTVARGSKVRHTFRLVNRLGQEVRIATWKSKCGCTEVRVGAQVIPPGTQTTIEAVIDTSKFVGYKPSGLTLVFQSPTPVEVDLNVSCFIRGDITLNPGVADFGIVPRSSVGGKPTMTLALTYAGGVPNWGITRIQTQSSSVSVRSQELGRSGSGQVQYNLTATLDPSALNGFVKDEITLFTNDPTGQTIPISVVVNVQSAVTVSPSPLILGQVKPGQVVTKTLLVRSSQPFKLAGIKPNRDELSAAAGDETLKPVHTVTLSFKAPAQPGPFNAVVEIASDIKDEPPVKLNAFATVVP